MILWRMQRKTLINIDMHNMMKNIIYTHVQVSFNPPQYAMRFEHFSQPTCHICIIALFDVEMEFL